MRVLIKLSLLFLQALLLISLSGCKKSGDEQKTDLPPRVSEEQMVADIKAQIENRLTLESKLAVLEKNLAGDDSAAAAQMKKLDDRRKEMYKERAKLDIERTRLRADRERSKDKKRIDRIDAELGKIASAETVVFDRETKLKAEEERLADHRGRLRQEMASLASERKLMGEERAKWEKLRKGRKLRLFALGDSKGKPEGVQGAPEITAKAVGGGAAAIAPKGGSLVKGGGKGSATLSGPPTPMAAAPKGEAKEEIKKLAKAEPQKAEVKPKEEPSLAGRTKAKKQESIKADAVSPERVDLSWDSFSDKSVAGYKIYRDGVFMKSVTGQAASLSDHEPGTSHCYTISAVDEAGNELKDKKNVCAKTLTPDGEAPSPPAALTAKPASQTQIDLSWSAASDNIGIKGYNVYREGSIVFTTEENRASLSGLAPGTEHCFVVTAFDAIKNESRQSNRACVSTEYADMRRPTPPAGLTASEVGMTEAGLSQIDLSWGSSIDDTGVTGYNIYKDGVFLKAVSSTSAFKIDVKPDETHCFMISAKDSTGNESRRSRQVCSTSKRSAGSKSYGGTVWTGGINDYGQLGHGGNQPLETLVMIKDMQGIVDIEVGVEHVVALKADGSVWAWGRNDKGQLGDGTTQDRYAPVPVKGLSGVVDIAAGMYHTLAMKADGTVWAWGRNYYGQLGDGSFEDRFEPIKVKGIGSVAAVASGWYHSVALRRDGRVWTWGWNLRGQLGVDDTDNRNRPVKVEVRDVELIAAGGEHTVVLKTDGTVWSWGRNKNGQLGIGKASDVDMLFPQKVQKIDGVEFLAAGADHTIALKSDGTVWGWGGNEYGQLGTNKGIKYPAPIHVAGVGQAKEVAAGAYHTVALRFDGSVWAWGWRMRERRAGAEAVPSQISGLTGIVDISAGRRFTAVLRGE